MKTKHKNIFKSLLALTLAFIMLLGAAPLSALAGVDFASLFAPKAEAVEKVYKVGDTFSLGVYPQTRVTDSATVTALNKVSKKWISYGYYNGNGGYSDSMVQGDWMKYADITYNGIKYRAVIFTQYRPYWTGYPSSAENTHQDENGYKPNNTYYFKYETLKWRVLDPKTGLVVCENIIDSQAYSNTLYEYGTDPYGRKAYWNDSKHTHYANDYATSGIRAWLNNEFYNTAFTASQKARIFTSKLENKAFSASYSKYDSKTTNDKVFLLSYSEMQNSAYGFASASARRAKGTDYAKCQGLWTDSSNKYSRQRVRSAGDGSDGACHVDSDGNLSNIWSVRTTDLGIRPALRVCLDVYNLGDETYGFKNFGDNDSRGGHCFGMSITSSGYYIGKLDRKNINKDTSKSLHSFALDAVKGPICYYQKIQGSYSNQAIVAGGSDYLTGKKNIKSDWDAVINYVKNHNYDDKGSLQIGLRKGNSGHAINFLYYKEVNGQQRIYAYDNNFPNVETYFYKGSDGKIYQAPQSTFGGYIECIALRDVAKYFSSVKAYKASRCVYAETGTIDVKESEYESQMEGSINGVEYTMYELPDEINEVTIIPLTEDASFSYMDEDYSFSKIDDETYGVLELAGLDDTSTGKADFSIVNEPISVTGIKLNESQKSLIVGDAFALTATIEPNDATDKSLIWSSSDVSVATVDENGVVTAVAEGNATISATASNGVKADCEVTVKKSESIFKKILNVILAPFRAIINLFKKLFGK